MWLWRGAFHDERGLRGGLSERRQEDVVFVEKHEVRDCNHYRFGAVKRLMSVDKNKEMKSAIRARTLSQDKV